VTVATTRTAVTVATTRTVRLTVEYEVTGTARAASLTLENDTGGTEQKTVRIPWSQSYTGFGRGDFVYVSAQNEGESGGLTCRVTVNGRVEFTSSSTGAYAICTASGSVP
jgi:hypothetical protein